jgi:hypothetical protein
MPVKRFTKPDGCTHSLEPSSTRRMCQFERPAVFVPGGRRRTRRSFLYSVVIMKGPLAHSSGSRIGGNG